MLAPKSKKQAKIGQIAGVLSSSVKRGGSLKGFIFYLFSKSLNSDKGLPAPKRMVWISQLSLAAWEVSLARVKGLLARTARRERRRVLSSWAWSKARRAVISLFVLSCLEILIDYWLFCRTQ